MATPEIRVGDEVKLRGVKNTIAVTMLNTAEHFCAITKEGFTFNLPREIALPYKTGRHFDAESFLKMLW